MAYDVFAGVALSSELRGHFLVVQATDSQQALRILEGARAVRAVVSERDLGEERTGFGLLRDVQRLAPDVARILVVPSPLSIADAAEFLRDRVLHRLVVKPWHRGEILHAVDVSVAPGYGTDRGVND